MQLEILKLKREEIDLKKDLIAWRSDFIVKMKSEKDVTEKRDHWVQKESQRSLLMHIEQDRQICN